LKKSAAYFSYIFLESFSSFANFPRIFFSHVPAYFVFFAKAYSFGLRAPNTRGELFLGEVRVRQDTANPTLFVPSKVQDGYFEERARAGTEGRRRGTGAEGYWNDPRGRRPQPQW